MNRDEMLRLFEAHREAEAARDIDGILDTFVPNPFLETMALGIRSEGRDAVRAAYEMQFFSAFPDLAPDDEGMAVGDETVVVWGRLRGTSRGDWLGVPPGGGTFDVPFANVVPFRDGLMAGEIIYFDLATLCEQAGISLDAVRAAAAARADHPLDKIGLSQVWRDDEGMTSGKAGAAGGGAIYGLGIFGAWVWFFQQADTFWQYVLAVFQGIFWPAFMVYQVFRALAG
jgi:hypothetical protein